MDNGKMQEGSDARRSFRVVSLVEISRYICNRIGENFQQILQAIRIEGDKEVIGKISAHLCSHANKKIISYCHKRKLAITQKQDKKKNILYANQM